MSELNTAFEVNGICYFKRTANTVAVIEKTLKYSGDVIIPESVTYNDVKYSVTEIEEDAFYDCSGLTSVSIPDSVTEIGASAFCDCGELTSIDVDSGNSMYCSYEGVVYSKDMKTLLICSGGKQGSFEIPDSVTEIGEYAFDGCCGLTSVIIPDSVTKIGDCAFYGCCGLTSIRIPDSVTEIDVGAFYGCSGLTSVRISDSVTEIGDGAFWDCSELTSISIPCSVTKIGEDAFYWCGKLSSIDVDSSNTMYCSHEGVVFSKDMKTLLICPKGKQGSFEIPDSVIEIGEDAFYGCRGLTSVSIPDSVTKIGRDAFHDCSGLTSIYIGANVSRIGNEFSSNAFQGCKLIEDIAVAAVVPPEADERTFDESVYAKAILRVPEAAIESYKSQGPWSKFATIKPLVKQ